MTSRTPSIFIKLAECTANKFITILNKNCKRFENRNSYLLGLRK